MKRNEESLCSLLRCIPNVKLSRKGENWVAALAASAPLDQAVLTFAAKAIHFIGAQSVTLSIFGGRFPPFSRPSHPPKLSDLLQEIPELQVLNGCVSVRSEAQTKRRNRNRGGARRRLIFTMPYI